MTKDQGLIYVFTGEGKGKTSAAIGVATRALLLDKNVIWIAFYKQEKWGLAEAKLKSKFANLEMIFTGRGFKISKPVGQQVGKSVKIAKVAGGKGVVVDTASAEEHKKAAEEGLKLAIAKLQGTEPGNDKPFLLVLDEVLNAVSDGLLASEQVLELLATRGETHVILTGRGDRPPFGSLPKGILDIADLVTECKKIKHPYDTGKLAVRGLDF